MKNQHLINSQISGQLHDLEFDSGGLGKALCWGLIEIPHVLVESKSKDLVRSHWCRSSSRDPSGVQAGYCKGEDLQGI